MAAATFSRCVIAWRSGGAVPASCKAVKIRVAGATARSKDAGAGAGAGAGALSPPRPSLQRAAVVLRELGSFKGDLAMMDTVAGLEHRGIATTASETTVPGWKLRARSQTPSASRAGGGPNATVPLMPEQHMYDQHVAGGIGHALNDSALAKPLRKSLQTFKGRYALVFDGVTGSNPRLGTVRLPTAPEVCAVRVAQRLHMVLTTPPATAGEVLRANGRPRQLAVTQSVAVHIPVSTGLLAAAVGPVAVDVKVKGASRRRKFVVLLGTVQPEAETVMVPPSRAGMKRDLCVIKHVDGLID